MNKWPQSNAKTEATSMTIPASITHTVQQTQEWLKEVESHTDLADETEALSVLRAVLHQLRDRLSIEESAQLSAQLPMLVRGIFFEGWQPTHVPDKSVRTQQEFFDGVKKRLLPRRVPPGSAVKAVFAILSHHIDPGEISDIIGQLPDNLKELWPLSARTFKERAR
jgi:uncharacterized protein (DUF2267 family)